MANFSRTAKEMYLRLPFVLIFAALTNASQKILDSCMKDNRMLYTCTNIKAVDLILIVNIARIYSSTSHNYKDTEIFYESLLRSFIRRTDFTYGPNRVRRAILTTQKAAPLYQVRQNFSHGEFQSDPDSPLFNKPYGDDYDYRLKTGLPELLSALKKFAEEDDRPGIQKIAIRKTVNQLKVIKNIFIQTQFFSVIDLFVSLLR